MLKINWKVRMKNPVFWMGFIPAAVSFIYTVLALLGVTPSITEDSILDLAIMLINMLTAIGVLVDPTTKGLRDTKQARSYQEPRSDE